MRHLYALLAALLIGLTARADTALGDAGHYLDYWPRLHLLNPDGQAFWIEVDVRRWPWEQWNPQEIQFTLTDPAGTVVLSGLQPCPGNRQRFAVPAGPAGVWTFDWGMNPDGSRGKVHPSFCLRSSLDRSVVWTGPAEGHATEDRRLVTQCSVPRRWWFFVPDEVTSFRIRAQRANRYMSQREDWDLTVYSPRGQRMTTLIQSSPVNSAQGDDLVATVPVEPGAGGRFWMLQIRLGDSHNYSNINVTLDGVPPYLARSPEEWFDPTTGQLAPISLYDDDRYMQFAREADERWPGLQHFSPCPSLGDPDGIMMRDFGNFALWNPEGRKLEYRIGSYLPRPETSYGLKLTGADHQPLLTDRASLDHLHDPKHYTPKFMPETATGVIHGQVMADRCYLFTYPATPLVMMDTPDDAWQRFNLEVGTARNLYFRVPTGTRSFEVRSRCLRPDGVLDLQVNAPDRVVAILYGNQGEQTVTVPPGLDGKLWHLRVDVGGATVMTQPEEGPKRYLDLSVEIGLRGFAPILLAPTWEQWFDPAHPQLPHGRVEPRP